MVAAPVERVVQLVELAGDLVAGLAQLVGVGGVWVQEGRVEPVEECGEAAAFSGQAAGVG